MSIDLGIDLLGGAGRHATRLRGFAQWRPRRGTLAVLDQAREVLREYAVDLPLIIRQIPYRLVGARRLPRKPKRPMDGSATTSAAPAVQR